MRNPIHFSYRGHKPVPPLTDRASWDTFTRHTPDMTPKCGFTKCQKHDAYVSVHGCQVCTD